MQHSKIRELAYKIWLAKGCPEGTAEDDWRAAERQLASSGAPSTEPSAPKPDASSSKTGSSPPKVDASSLKLDSSSAPLASKGVDDTSKGSFPASDPPASHLPDKPPSNADEKWDAAGLPRKQTTRRTSKPTAPRTQGR